MVTKSGTRDFHGDLFEFVRNDEFDANDWFINQAGQRREPLKRNNCGFTVGGPVYIPKHYNTDQNKTFLLCFSKSGAKTGKERSFDTFPSVMQPGRFQPVRSGFPNLYKPWVAFGLRDSDQSGHGRSKFPDDLVPIMQRLKRTLERTPSPAKHGRNPYTRRPVSRPTSGKTCLRSTRISGTRFGFSFGIRRTLTRRTSYQPCGPPRTMERS